jgi:hypothetical protein
LSATVRFTSPVSAAFFVHVGHLIMQLGGFDMQLRGLAMGRFVSVVLRGATMFLLRKHAFLARQLSLTNRSRRLVFLDARRLVGPLSPPNVPVDRTLLVVDLRHPVVKHGRVFVDLRRSSMQFPVGTVMFGAAALLFGEHTLLRGHLALTLGR